jgi:hypothetical protein
MRSLFYKIKYFKSNWKEVIHLLFGTYRFGVNNDRWSSHDSMWGVPWNERFKPSKLKQRYQMMKIRACAGLFIPSDEAKKLFPSFFRKRK